jgi:serine/threonine protein kinase
MIMLSGFVVFMLLRLVVARINCQPRKEFTGLINQLFDCTKIRGFGGNSVVWEVKYDFGKGMKKYAAKVVNAEISESYQESLYGTSKFDAHKAISSFLDEDEDDDKEFILPNIKAEISIHSKIWRLRSYSKFVVRLEKCIRLKFDAIILIEELLGRSLQVSLNDQSFGKSLALRKRLFLYKGLITGVKFMHDRKIAHCDIKFENILKSLRHPNHFVFIDLGSGVFDASCIAGTISYFALENSMDIQYEETKGYSQDIWSLGIVLGVVEQTVLNSSADGYFYDDRNSLPENTDIARSHDSLILQLELTYASAYQDLSVYKLLTKMIRRMLDYDPRNRINVHECLKNIDLILNSLPNDLEELNANEFTPTILELPNNLFTKKQKGDNEGAEESRSDLSRFGKPLKSIIEEDTPTSKSTSHVHEDVHVLI